MITAQLVKDLREKTGAGMMDCKKALIETQGDFEAAVDWLRTKGLAAAAKKAGRVAADGLVCVASSGKHGTVVEINAETDFVARNPQFQEFVQKITRLALDEDLSIEQLQNATLDGKSVADTLSSLIAVIGENISLRRVNHLKVNDGAVATYIHSSVIPNMGKIGVLVALESKASPDLLTDWGKKIAMHIAATAPLSLSSDAIDPKALERERAIFMEQARASGKPEEFITKMVDGRIRKFYEEVVLLEQAFVMDPQKRVKDVVGTISAEHPAKLIAFTRFALGEGIEKETTDFAAEVMAQAGAK
jgi:elongation factor Ts